MCLSNDVAASAAAGRLIPKNEVMVVLDADMVAERDFFVRYYTHRLLKLFCLLTAIH